MKRILPCLLIFVTSHLFGQAVSPDGKYIALTTKKTVGVFELTTGDSVRLIQDSDEIIGLGFSNDETRLVIQNEKYVFTCYDLNEEEPIWEADIREYISVPEKFGKVFIKQTKDESNYAVLQHNQLLFLDAETGDLTGFKNLQSGSGRASRDIRGFYETAPNQFSIGYTANKGYTLGQLTFDGAGYIDEKKQYEKSNEFTPLGAYYPGKALVFNRTSYKVMNDFGTELKEFKSPRINGLFSDDGNFLAAYGDAKIIVLDGSSFKKVSTIKYGASALFVNDDHVVTADGSKYYVFGTKSGKSIYEGDKTEELSYQGSGINASRYMKTAGVLFFDGFDDNHNEWYEGSNENGNESVTSGNYQLINKTEDSHYSVSTGKVSIDPFRDFEIEVRLKNDGEDAEHGIFWGRNKTHGYRSVFHIKNSGEFWIGRYQRGKWLASKSWTASESIKSRDYNLLKVTKTGSKCTYSINDTPVFEEEFKGLNGHKTGFYYPPGTTLVDYIKISYLNENVLSEIPVYYTSFDDNSDNWASGRKEGSYDQRVENGYYRYENMRENGSRTKWNYNLFIDEDQNYEVEMALRFESSNTNYMLGLEWGKNKDGDRYRFGISKNGGCAIDKYVNGAWKTLSDWQSNVTDPTKWTTLKIQKINGKYKFYVNGKVVEILGGLYDKEVLSYGPIIGITVPSQSVAHFDYIKAKYINRRSDAYKSYRSRTGLDIYIPYMRWNDPGNTGKKVLIGDPIYCKKFPKTELGGMKLASTTQKVKFRVMKVDEPDEVDWMKGEIRKLHGNGNGWLVWNHSIGCK